MKITKTECQCCGGNLKKKGGKYECEFCGSQFIIDSNNEIENSVVTDAKIINLYVKAAECMVKKNFTDELKALSEALELDDKNANTLIKMGRCYRSLGFTSKAIEMYHTALEIDPLQGAAYTNLGTIYILKNDWSNAARQYEQGLPLIDQNTDDYWTAYANYAICIAKTGDPNRAKKMIKEAERHGYSNGDGCRKLAGLSRVNLFSRFSKR